MHEPAAAALAPYLSDDLLDSVNSTLLSKLEGKGLKQESVHTYMHALGAIRHTPARCCPKSMPSG